MGFRETEKKRLVLLKGSLFSAPACAPGTYGNSTYDFCLADDCSQENIHTSIRGEALEYFQNRKIPWHGGKGKERERPSNHLCCSQSACANFWFPFVRNVAALRHVLLHVGYPVAEVLPFEADRPLSDGKAPYVAFEWIGEKNYLGELKMGHRAPDGGRSRGANFTSADFAFRFRRNDGKVEIVLGEWKYTERYAAGACIQFSKSKSKTDRLGRVYREHLSKPNCQIRLAAGIEYKDLFYDPFDQMMRLQLLASAMEHEHEHADVVSVLHVAPQANTDLVERITSPVLAAMFAGQSIHDVQHALVEKHRFKGLFMEQLLPIVVKYAPDNEWGRYMERRYQSRTDLSH